MKIPIGAICGIASAILSVSCSVETPPTSESSLKQSLISAGPMQVLEVLRNYPDPELPMVKSKQDWIFLIEIAEDNVSEPLWLNSSLPEFPRARSLAIYFLAIDHQNEHFTLNADQVMQFREIAKKKILDPSTDRIQRLEDIRVLGAVGNASDVHLIENYAMQSTEGEVVKNAALSLALMCETDAPDALQRVLSAKESQFTDEFRKLVLRVMSDKRRTMCKRSANDDAKGHQSSVK